MTGKLCAAICLLQIISISSQAGGPKRTISRKAEIIDTLHVDLRFKDGYQLGSHHVQITDELVKKYNGKKAKAVGYNFFEPTPPWSKPEPASVQCDCQLVSKVDQKGDTLYKLLYYFHPLPVPRKYFIKERNYEYIYAYKNTYGQYIGAKDGDSLFYPIWNGPMYVGFGLKSLFVWNDQSEKWDLVYTRPKDEY